MAIDLGSPNLNQQPPNLSKWMQSTRRPPPPASQELWAFVEDTSSATSTVWPPRSYACTFCHREFRSAQALGGHMNVHRRDRAQLQQSPQQLGASSKASSPAVGFRLPESVPSGSFCIFQSAPAAGSPTGGFLAVWPYLGDGLVSAYQFMEPAGQDGNGKEYLRVSSIHDKDNNNGSVVEEELEEELDLELRLGRKSTHGFTFTQGMIYKTNG